MFDHAAIEAKWARRWEEAKVYRTKEDAAKGKYYVLDMFPYPSGAGLHVGHPKGYTATDVVARYKNALGHAVLHPMGWDAFGLPAEHFALKTNSHPAPFTLKNIATFKRQLNSMGYTFDWEREVNTTDPRYYATTQWIFSLLYKRGLAERRDVDVNWSPDLGTVLANEEVVAGPDGNMVTEHGGYPVEKRAMRQWVLRITDYAERLVKDLETLDWPDSLKNIQRKWIYTTNDDGSLTLHLRDWIFSRQRYWGEPFPIAFSEDGKDVLLIEKLPVTLPPMDDFKPTGTGEGPLALAERWLTEIPGYRRETHTMPQWAGSCWYYLAYLLRKTDGSYVPIDSPQAKAAFEKWLPVDLYIGGQEHAVLHLLYARFWHKVLYDAGVLPQGKRYAEPFQRIINVGMILGTDGTKMSKSRGNTVSPDDIVKAIGADALRLYVMFMGPLTASLPWSDEGLHAMRKWLERVYRLFDEHVDKTAKKQSPELEKAFAKCLSDVERDLANDAYNTPVSAMMVFVNECYRVGQVPVGLLDRFTTVLSLYAPFSADELRERLGLKGFAYDQKWPVYDKSLLEETSFNIAVEVNGKVKYTLVAPVEADEEAVLKLVRDDERTIVALAGRSVKREIYVRGKIVNLVV